jgi:hypothetical protein
MVVKNINIRESNITSIYIEDRDFKYKKCTIEGIGLREAVHLKFIKQDCIITSNLYAAYELFGIIGYFAASLINLFMIGKDKKVNPKHAAAISFVICYNDTLVALTREGFNKICVDKWPILSFERQATNFAKIALKNSTDNGKSINSQIIYGQKPQIGSNHAEVHFDIDTFKKFSNYKIAQPKENTLYNLIKEKYV